MWPRLKFILLQLLVWLCFFELARIVFLLYHHAQASQLPFKVIALTFVYGFRMDLSMACYLVVLPALFALFSIFIPLFRNRIIYSVYNGIALFLLLLIVFADLEMYKQWGYRLDSTVLQYLSSPKEVLASTGHLPVFWILLLFVLTLVGFLFLFNRLVYRSIFLLHAAGKRRLISFVAMACFIASLVIPMRGGFQMQPMNPGWVYFSTSDFANVTALNGPWNFFQDVLDKQRETSNPYQYFASTRVKAIIDSLYTPSNAHVQLVDTSSGRLNVIFIVWESFTKKIVDTVIDGREVCPNFNRLKKEGVYFNNIYASGDRTHKAMSAIFSGYPALPNTSIIRFPQKSARLNSISNLFKQHGYTNQFFYGGDPAYDNYKSYLLHGGFDRITGERDFNSKEKLSKWGAVDGAVASYMTNNLKNWKQPFFHCWLTLSSHVPYKIPLSPVFKGNDETTKFLNSIRYTDSVVARFIDDCQKQSWWKNTLLVIVADHGIRFPQTGRMIDDFKLPMLWLGGAVEKNKGMVVRTVCSQTDIAATLMKQLNWANSPFPFSRDITDTASTRFAFFSNSTGFSIVQPDRYFIYDTKGMQIKEQQGSFYENDLIAGKALQQFIYDDYLKK